MRRKETRSSLQVHLTSFDEQLSLDSAFIPLGYHLPTDCYQRNRENLHVIFLMLPLVIQIFHQSDNAVDPREFSWRKTFLKFKSIFIYRVKRWSRQNVHLLTRKLGWLHMFKKQIFFTEKYAITKELFKKNLMCY